MLPAMAAKPKITIVGPGRLGTVLAVELVKHGYRLQEIVSSNRRASVRSASQLARKVHARAATQGNARLDADLIWFCVPDRAIAQAARQAAGCTKWKGKTAFHSSGALASDELAALRRRGAAVASVHPLMTFVRGSTPSLRGVPFAVEDDAEALGTARRIVGDLGGEVLTIRKQDKVAYHAWGTFASPLLLAALVTAERVARASGLPAAAARTKMLPIIRQTIENYGRLGPAAAFSGPIVRGDAAIVVQHLRALRKVPEAKNVYVALARAALRYLPARNRKQITKALNSR